MSGIKITNADRWFGKCIKLAVNYRCEVCNTVYDESSTGLHTSHYFGRAHKRLRHEPDNAFAHCYGCHQKLGANPHDFAQWVYNKIGEGRYQMLIEARRETIKWKKQTEKEVADHYREEFKRLKKLREDGENGDLEVTGYW